MRIDSRVFEFHSQAREKGIGFAKYQIEVTMRLIRLLIKLWVFFLILKRPNTCEGK